MTRRRRAPGEGSIHQRERDGMWVATLELPRGPGGKRNRKTYTAKTQQAVRAKLRDGQRKLEKGRDLFAAPGTVADLLKAWLEFEILPSGRQPATKQGYETQVRRHIVPILGHLPLAKLDPLAVRRLHQTMGEQGLGARSQQYAHQTLGTAIQWAVHNNLLDRNVVRLVRSPKPERDPSRVHAIPEKDMGRILVATRGQPLHPFWILLASTALRKGEALGLRWRDVDLDEMTIRVEQTLQRVTGQGLVFKKPKSSDSRRLVPIPQMTVDALRAHRTLQAKQRLAAGDRWTDLDLVFAGPLGKPLDPSAPNEALRAVTDELEIPSERVHNIRHTVASLDGVVADGDTLALTRFMGHGYHSVTIGYRHTPPRALRELAERIGIALEIAQETETG